MNVPRGTVLKAKLAVQSANLRQISDAAKPLYDSLDDRQRRRLVQFVRIVAASPRLAPRLNTSSLWLMLARPDKKRRKS
jgi:hypothetical protein